MAVTTSERIIDLARLLPPGEQIKIVTRLSEGLISGVSGQKAPAAAPVGGAR